MTTIEWTQRPDTKGETWNPLIGCTIVSPGCSHCYAMRMGHRIQAMGGKGAETYAGTTRVVNGHPVWTGKVNVAPEETLLKPLRWREPRTVFVNSMSDLFHESVPDEVIDRVFAIMALTPQHTYQVLTKRSARMREYFTTPYRPGKFISILDDGSLIDTGAASVRARSAMCDLFPRTPPRALNDAIAWQDQHYPDGDGFMRRWPLPNVWLGVSAERQHEADQRIPDLLATPAAIRFVSAEPLLGEIDLTRINLGIRHTRGYGAKRTEWDAFTGWEHQFPDHSEPGCDPLNAHHHGIGECGAPGKLDWIIVGGESGPGARPMHPAWARSIRDQCAAAGTVFFFKQWGNWISTYDRDREDPDWRRVPKPGDWDRKRFLNRAGGQGFHGEELHMMENVGKSRAGRLLDGAEHSAYPLPCVRGRGGSGGARDGEGA